MKKEPSQKEMQQFNTMYMYRHENVRYRSQGGRVRVPCPLSSVLVSSNVGPVEAIVQVHPDLESK